MNYSHALWGLFFFLGMSPMRVDPALECLKPVSTMPVELSAVMTVSKFSPKQLKGICLDLVRGGGPSPRVMGTSLSCNVVAVQRTSTSPGAISSVASAAPPGCSGTS